MANFDCYLVLHRLDKQIIECYDRSRQLKVFLERRDRSITCKTSKQETYRSPNRPSSSRCRTKLEKPLSKLKYRIRDNKKPERLSLSVLAGLDSNAETDRKTDADGKNGKDAIPKSSNKVRVPLLSSPSASIVTVRPKTTLETPLSELKRRVVDKKKSRILSMSAPVLVGSDSKVKRKTADCENGGGAIPRTSNKVRVPLPSSLSVTVVSDQPEVTALAPVPPKSSLRRILIESNTNTDRRPKDRLIAKTMGMGKRYFDQKEDTKEWQSVPRSEVEVSAHLQNVQRFQAAKFKRIAKRVIGADDGDVLDIHIDEEDFNMWIGITEPLVDTASIVAAKQS